MKFIRALQAYSLRHALSAALAVLIATLMTMYFSYSQEGWLLLAAFVTSQTTRGTPIRQAMIYLVVFALMAVLSAYVRGYAIDPHIVVSILTLVLMGSVSLIIFVRPIDAQTNYRILYIPLLLFVVMLLPLHANLHLQEVMLDIAIGGLVGMACAEILLPRRFDRDFRHGIVPLLKAMHGYHAAIREHFLQTDTHPAKLEDARLTLERALYSQQSVYPAWVYEVGFNPGLRGGYRFFLVNIERSVEILFSMHYLAGLGIRNDLLQQLSAVFTQVTENNLELLQVLQRYAEGSHDRDTKSDFTSDIKLMESILGTTMPGGIELLDISRDYITLTAFARNLKDMRSILLALVLALP